MSSKSLYKQSSSSIGTYKDSETQTSQIYDLSTTSNTKPSRPLPQNIESKNENLKLFEFCEIIQDPSNPDSVTLIKETFSEEVLKTTPKGSYFEKPTANKYIYCKEVIEPYLKSFSSECPSIVTPRDKLTKSPVDEPEEPDYQPDYEIYSNSKPFQERKNSRSRVSAMNSDDKCKTHCKTTFVNPKDSTNNCPCKTDEKKPCEKITNKCPSKTDQKKSCEKISSATKCPEVPKCSTKENEGKKSCERPKSPTCPKCDQVDESKLTSCIASCIKESLKAVKSSSAVCVNEVHKLIGVKPNENCEDKPTYYLLEKPRCPSCSGQTNNSSTSIPQKCSAQKFFDSQTQTIATIQCALKDFVGSVCTKTKEAVEVLKSESCKIKSESATIRDKDNKPTDCSNLKSLSSIIPEKIKAEIDKIDISTGCESLEKIVEPAKEVLYQVASAVLSTVSVTKEAGFKKIADDILDAKFNKSSPFDQSGVSHKPPRQVSQEHESSTNMFTTIKTKLFSIFGQKESQDDDDDDDDEISAEKFFDKYCDQ